MCRSAASVRRRVRAVAHVGAVQRDRVPGAAQRERRPGGQPEVGVDDVELRGAVAAAQRRGRERVGERPRAGTRKLDLDVGDPPQRRHLVAHEHAARRALARGRHVRDHQRAHGRTIAGDHLGSWRRCPRLARAPNERPIAVFDSGVGGLTVLQELLVELPARGLPLPRRHRPLPLRRAQRAGARELRAPDRASCCWHAARSCSSSPATRPAHRRSTRCASGCSRRPSGCR